MVKYYFLTAIAVLLLICDIFSQTGNTTVDSLESVIKNTEGKQQVKAMNTLSWEIKYNDPGKALTLSEQALKQAEEFNDVRGKMMAFRNLSALCAIKGEATDCKRFADSALQYALSLDDKFQQGKIYNLKAIGYRKQNKISQAIKYQDSALKQFEEIGDSAEIIGNLHNKAVTYELANDYLSAFELYKKVLDYEQRKDNASGICRTAVQLGVIANKNGDLYNAKRYHKMALNNARKINNKRWEAAVLNDLGGVYMDSDSDFVAVDYFNKALKINTKHNFKDYLAINLSNLGKVYMEINLAKAQEYYTKAVDIQKELNLTEGYILDVVNLAEVNRKLGKFKKAKELAEKALAKAESIDFAKGLRSAYFEMSQLSEKAGEYEEALDYYKNYTFWKDSLKAFEQKKYLSDLQAKYDFQKMQKENEKLQMKNQLQEVENWQQKISLLVVIIISVFVFIIAIILFFSRKKMMRLNRLLDQQQKEIHTQKKELEESLATKDKFFSIIAHDLKNPFMGIMGFADLLKEKTQNINDNELKNYASYIYSSSRDLFELLENLLKWSKAQRNDFKVTIVDPINLRKETQKAIDQIGWPAKEKNIQIVNEIPDEVFVQSDKNILNTLLRNLVNNAVKYSYKNSSIVIGEHESNDQITVFVKDSGTGISEDMQKDLFEVGEKRTMPGTNHESGTGLGLVLCKELIEKQNGSIWFESIAGKGSTFYFSLTKSM
ncbi:MAG: tetratricopeptide repeat-containing sensor histidine kinase [Bacteroidales bacterium]|nr:tetratricopeptide repeat-containing sensor histidine kinase [Bacteroidales bacterium]